MAAAAPGSAGPLSLPDPSQTPHFFGGKTTSVIGRDGCDTSVFGFWAAAASLLYGTLAWPSTARVSPGPACRLDLHGQASALPAGISGVHLEMAGQRQRQHREAVLEVRPVPVQMQLQLGLLACLHFQPFRHEAEGERGRVADGQGQCASAGWS